MRTVICDIETDTPDQKAWEDMGQLSVSRIEGIGVWVEGLAPEYIDCDGVTFLQDGDVVVGHNFIRFDWPVLQRLYGLMPEVTIHDTLIMSKVLCPARESHSLASWAADFGLVKPDLSDKRERCLADLEITRQLYKHLCALAERQGVPQNVFTLEYKVAEIIARQHASGILFDAELARQTVAQIDGKRERIHAEAAAAEPCIPIPPNKLDHPPLKQFKKDGTPSALLLRYLEKYGVSLDDVDLPLKGPIRTTQPLDISSQDEVKGFLLSKGWKPTLWNISKTTGKRTSPKLYGPDKELCPNLAAMNSPVVQNIAEYLSLGNRRHVILGKDGETGWLANTRLKIDGRLCPDADTLGAETARFTHKIVANVPRVTSFYGKEMRSLFTAPPGRVLVGWDASSLEARMEAHYVHPFDNGAYMELVLAGDIHMRNKELLGFTTKDDAKRFKYAIGYGAGAPKLSSIFGWTEKHANDVLQEYWANNPALVIVKRNVTQEAERNGWITGLDGRRIICPSPHAALARLFQSAGAITMKYAMVLSDKSIRNEKLDAFQVIHYHDECQFEAAPECADRVGELGVHSVRNAGRYLKLKVPLDAEYKVGKNWSLTH